MALWNDKREGVELVPCPVCGALVCRKKRTTHLTSCLDSYKDRLSDVGLMKCPLYPLHVFPKKYLNHHLEGNCEEALNMLRKFFQKVDIQKTIKLVPDEFLAEYPEKIINKHNKQLLYILQRDLDGNDLSNRQDLYPRGRPSENVQLQAPQDIN